MSTNNTTPAADTNTPLIAYQVKEVEKNGESKDYWTRIGAAFAHKDGKGFNIVLDSIPLDGKVVLRPYEPKPDSE